MTLLKDYISAVDYFICPKTIVPPPYYQRYKQILFLDEIHEQDIELFRNKIIYIFFTTVSQDILNKLCLTAKSVYFINSSSTENIRSVCALSAKKDNLHSFLTNYEKDEYINFLNSVKE
jgi:hypothetical protein